MDKIRNLSVPSLLALALVSLTVSTIFDGGFFKGMFQGAAAALLVLAVLMVVLGRRAAKAPRGVQSDQDMWLPSRDEER